MSKQRIYLVSSTDGEYRLVRAATRHQSVMHVAQTQYSSHVADQDELVACLKRGIEIESYKDADQTELDLEAE